tara:strand:+ start:846 stop:1406 length:561 start_codon:yes stop_codon:yes gene_type:complete
VIPLTFMPYKAIGIGLMALAAWGAWEWRWSEGYDAGVSSQQAKQAVIDDQRKQTAIEELTRRRVEEARTVQLLQEATDAKDRAEAQQRADKLIADAASGDLRRRFEQRLRDLVQAVHATASSGAGSGDTQVASSSASADDPAILLANVFSRIDARAGQLAEYADQARTAGELCQRSYDALTPTATR